jgi:predicted Zn-dependent protease
MGLIAFVDFGSQVFVMIALSPQETWAMASPAVAATFASFRKISDPKLANVEPMRVRAVKLDRPTTLAAFSQAQPSVISMEELALINHVEPNEALPEGRWVKRVVGFNPEPPEQPAGGRQEAAPGSVPGG